MAQILILTLVFPPDNVSTAHLMGELAQDLRAKGHVLGVLTTEPHYNPDPGALKEQPLKATAFGVIKRSQYRGIDVYHT